MVHDYILRPLTTEVAEAMEPGTYFVVLDAITRHDDKWSLWQAISAHACAVRISWHGKALSNPTPDDTEWATDRWKYFTVSAEDVNELEMLARHTGNGEDVERWCSVFFRWHRVKERQVT